MAERRKGGREGRDWACTLRRSQKGEPLRQEAENNEADGIPAMRLVLGLLVLPFPSARPCFDRGASGGNFESLTGSVARLAAAVSSHRIAQGLDYYEAARSVRALTASGSCRL